MALFGGQAVTLKVGADLLPFKRKMSGLKSSVGGLGKTLAKPFRMGALAAGAFTTAVGASFIAISTYGIKSAMAVQTAFAEVGTIVDKTAFDLKQAEEAIQSLSLTMGTSMVDSTKALYQTISSGFTDQAEALKIVEDATHLAVGGLTDVATATDAIVVALNSFTEDMLTSDKVAAKLFKTVKLGRINMEQLGSSFGRVSGLASSFGVSIDETLGAIAVLTKTLAPTEAVSALRAVISGLARPIGDAVGEYERLGVEYGVVSLKSKGLAKSLTDLVSAGADEESFVKLFGRIDGLNAVMRLASDNVGDLMSNIDELAFAETEHKDASADMLMTVEQQWKRFKSSVDAMVRSIGKEHLGTLEGFFGGFADTVRKHFEGPEGVQGIIDETGEAAKEAGKGIGEAFGTQVLEAFKTMKQWSVDIKEYIVTNWPEIKNKIEEIGTALNGLIKLLGTLVGFRDSLAWLFAPSVGNGSVQFSQHMIELLAKQRGKGYQSGGYVSGPYGTDAVPANLTRGEYVINPDATAAFMPLLSAINSFRGGGGGGGGYDNSTFNLNMNFTGAVTRETVRRVIVPEVQRAWEIGSIKRQRGIR